MTGTFGTDPASNAARLISRKSVSNRTGTSNSKPALTTAPETGAMPKLHDARARIQREIGALRNFDPIDRETQTPRNRLPDRPRIGRSA